MRRLACVMLQHFLSFGSRISWWGGGMELSLHGLEEITSWETVIPFFTIMRLKPQFFSVLQPRECK